MTKTKCQKKKKTHFDFVLVESGRVRLINGEKSGEYHIIENATALHFSKRFATTLPSGVSE